MAPFLPLAPSSWTATPTDDLKPIGVRQDSTTVVTVTATSIPSSSSNTVVLSGGAIAGIVIGTIVGTVLLLWIIRSCFYLGRPTLAPTVEPWYGRETETKRHSYRHHRRPRSRRRSRSSSVTLPSPVVVRQETRRSRRKSGGSRRAYSSY